MSSVSQMSKSSGRRNWNKWEKKLGCTCQPSIVLHAKHSLTQSSWMCIPSLETGHCIQLEVSGGRSSEDFGHGVTVNIYLISPRRVLNILMIPLSLPLNWRSIFCGIPPPLLYHVDDYWSPLSPPPPINEDFECWSPYITKFSDECFSQFAWPARVLIRPFTGQQNSPDHVCN